MQQLNIVNLSLVIIAATYVYAAVVTSRAWLSGRARSLRWVTLAMAVYALDYLVFRVADFSTDMVHREPTWVAVFIGLTIPQWALLHFAFELTDAGPRLRRVSDAAFVVTLVVQLIFPARIAVGSYPDPPTSAIFAHAVIAIFVAYATGLGAVLLWRKGRRMPTLVRNRYRMLAIAVVVMWVAMLLGGVREYPLLLVFAALLVAATFLIVAAAIPPRWLRDAWQAPLLRRVLRELADVSTMTDQEAVRARLLPTIARAASAQRAVMHDVESGRTLESYGSSHGTRSQRVLLPGGSIELELIGTPHDPFFGNEQRQLVQDLGLHLQAALDRCGLIEREREAASTMSAANLRLRTANAELSELAELRDGFVAIASHELRTPITTIMGFTSTLLDLWGQIDDPERLRYLELVDRDARRLGQLVGDLLLLSSVESADFRVARNRIVLRDLLEQVLADLGRDGRHVELRVDDRFAVNADPRHLRQVFVNLLANAARHGKPPVLVRARAIGEFDDKVQVEVIDHGAGVPEEFRERLFGRFARAESSDAIPGHGLGLFIVRRLVEVQGGRVWLEPRDGYGACFMVELPAAAPVPDT